MFSRQLPTARLTDDHIADDASLFQHAIAVAMHNLTRAAWSMTAGLLQSQAARYGDAVHPIFHAAACPETQCALQALGCDVDELVSALDRLMTHGSKPQANVRSNSAVIWSHRGWSHRGFTFLISDVTVSRRGHICHVSQMLVI